MRISHGWFKWKGFRAKLDARNWRVDLISFSIFRNPVGYNVSLRLLGFSCGFWLIPKEKE